MRSPFSSLALSRGWLAVCFSLLICGGAEARAGNASASADAFRSAWLNATVLGERNAAAKPTPFFSFVYGGRPSSEFLAGWKVDRADSRLDDRRVRHTVTYTDPASDLVVRCVAVEYQDYPTVEWTLYFRNGGSGDTPMISAVLPLDAAFDGGKAAFPILHYNEGGYAGASAYQPHEQALGAEQTPFEVVPGGGMSTNQRLPYFNLEYGTGGVIVAIGWPGQWKAAFDANGRVRAGQELTHFILHGGEEVRTPLIALQFWQGGDWIDAQNVWRRWMLAHNLPQVDGKNPPPQLAANSSHELAEMIQADEANQIEFIDGYVKQGIKLSYWWMDAGWYSTDGIWSHVGTWKVDAKRFPRGLRAVSDHAHAHGIKTIVWFEPERISAGSWLWNQHPDWLLGDNPDQRLINWGNPDALKWASEYFSQFITDQGVDLYRQDYNFAPLPYWRAADQPDRQGITEIRYVEGFLAYWDYLRRAHPGMLIDSCAGGGRRNDLETARRSIPLLRSDYLFEPLGQQGHTYGMAAWLPYQGTGVMVTDPYGFRSSMTAAVTGGYDVRKGDVDFPALRQRLSEWRSVAALFLADYYPLSPYSLSETAWMIWQFNRPEKDDGMVQAFRRARSADSSTVRLRGLRESSTYVVTSIDGGPDRVLSGRLLMNEGLPITIAAQPGAAIYRYHLSGSIR
jgi:alpha-galactosidase